MSEQDERQWAEQSDSEQWEREMQEEWDLLCQRCEEAFEKIFGEKK